MGALYEHYKDKADNELKEAGKALGDANLNGILDTEEEKMNKTTKEAEIVKTEE